MNIGDRVRSERNRLGLSQDAFDRHVGLSLGHTSMIEIRGSAGIKTLTTIANRLGIRLEYLANGEEPRQEKETRRRKTA